MLQEKQSNQNKLNTDYLKWIIVALIGFAVIILTFGTGMLVGGMKARFSYRWAESYHKNFAGPKVGFFGEWRKLPPFPGDFVEGHGSFGKIIKLNDVGFVMNGRGDMEKIILTTPDKKQQQTFEIILPNLIHKSKKRNLH